MSRAKSPYSTLKNTSTVGKSLTDASDQTKIEQAASTLFERQSKLGVMKEVMRSPHIRRTFQDNERGYEKFESYHN